jgi:hypothetical protein
MDGRVYTPSFIKREKRAEQRRKERKGKERRGKEKRKKIPTGVHTRLTAICFSSYLAYGCPGYLERIINNKKETEKNTRALPI